MVKYIAGVMVVGAELVSEKLLALIEQAFKLEENNGIRVLSFRADGRPEGVFGMCNVDTGAVALNLEQMWQKSVKNLRDPGYFTTLRAAIWWHQLTVVFHEMYHLAEDVRDHEASMMVDAAKAEDKADDYAIQMMGAIALKYDVEPPALENEPFFGPRVMALALDKKGMSDAQRVQLEDGVMYENSVAGSYHKEFRTYVRLLIDPERRISDWELPTVGVNVTYTLPDGTHMEQKAVKVETPVSTATAVPVAIPVAAPLAMTAAADGCPPGVDLDVPLEEQRFYVNQADIGEDDGGVDAMIEQAVAAAAGGFQGAPSLFTAEPAPYVPVAPPVVAQVVAAPVDPDMPKRELYRTEEAWQDGLAIYNERKAGVAALPTKVPLTGAIGQAAATMAAAPTMNVVPVQTATQYPPQAHALTFEQMKACAEEMFMVCYASLFTRLGWQGANGGGMTQMAEVLKPIDVSSILRKHGCEGFIMEYKTLDAEGHIVYEKANAGQIRGIITPVAQVPAYELCFNANGAKVTRTIMAQNINKTKADGSLSKPAVDARAGHAIAWVMNPDEPDAKKKFKFEIKDNVMRALTT